MRGPSREPLDCFETNHGPRGFQLLIARCHANQEGHLSRWRTSEKLAGQRGSPLNVLSMPPDVNRVDLRNAVDTATLCSLSTQPRLTPGAGSLFACHVVPSPSRSGTKWNFHFLVCEWVSPTAFVWYLFIPSMWQEQCAFINISAFTWL